MTARVYLDWNAPRRFAPRRRRRWLLLGIFAAIPPRSMPRAAQARRLVEDARAAIAAAVGARPAERRVRLRRDRSQCAGADAGAAAGRVAGAAAAGLRDRARLGAGGRPLSADAIARIAVTRSGLVDLDALSARSPMARRRWYRSCWPTTRPARCSRWRRSAEIVHAAGGLLHVDAIQAFGKIPFDISASGADLLTLSAHKIGGPKGVGAVVLAEGLQGLEPLLRGGGQELGRRAGTENVAGIRRSAPPAKAAMAALGADAVRLEGLRDRLEERPEADARYDRILATRWHGCPIPRCSRCPV